MREHVRVCDICVYLRMLVYWHIGMYERMYINVHVYNRAFMWFQNLQSAFLLSRCAAAQLLLHKSSCF